MEKRESTKGNAEQQTTRRTQSRASVSHELSRVREAARRDRTAKFTALFHHVTMDRLRSAYLALSPKAAAGVDGVNFEQYGERLAENLRALHSRLHRGAYRAKPSRRAFIPKPDGRQRPLGIATLEDKIVQRAVVEVLNAIYEVDFLGFSYGFRPNRSAHGALDALAVGIEHRRVNFVLDADIRDFYGTIDHGWMMKFVEHRIADERMLRLIRKWLSAGVIEEGVWTETTEGVPQGASISCLLANIYLHYVFDLWTQQWRRKHASGDMIAVRYADDVALGFQHEEEARKYTTELGERLSRFGLMLHADKTRLLRFGKRAEQQRKRRGERKPETFHFLGFTHICGRDRRGRFALQRRTEGKRQRAELREVKKELLQRRHLPIPEQGVAGQRNSWACGLLRGAQQRRPSLRIQERSAAALVSSAPASKPAKPTELGEDAEADSAVPPSNPHHAPLARGALHSPTPKVRAQCASCARWDPCGGRPDPKRAKGRSYRDPKIPAHDRDDGEATGHGRRLSQATFGPWQQSIHNIIPAFPTVPRCFGRT